MNASLSLTIDNAREMVIMDDEETEFSKGWWAYHQQYGDNVSELNRYINYLEAKLRVEEKVKDIGESLPPPT